MSSKDLKDTKRQDINASLIVVGTIIFIAVIGLYLALIFDKHYEPNWDILWIPAVVVFILVIIFILSTILVINRLLKDNKMTIEPPTCESKIGCLVKETYPHAKGYISRHFSVLYDSHEKFVKDISLIKDIKKTELTDITKDAVNSIHGRFLCVLSDSRYYPADGITINQSPEAKELIEYFFRFEKHTEKNHITRIFNWNPNETAYSKRVFLQYLLANDIAGMDTYVLFSKEPILTGLDSDIPSKYFPYIDYVISDILHKDTHSRETKVYFSCDVSEKEPDSVIVSNDNFLLHLLETDFANRLDLKDGKKTQNHCTQLSKANFVQILEDIGLINTGVKKNIYKDDINEIITELYDFINQISENTASSGSKQKLMQRLKTWYIKNR